MFVDIYIVFIYICCIYIYIHVYIFRDLSGLLKFTFRRHKFDQDAFSSEPAWHEALGQLRQDAPASGRRESHCSVHCSTGVTRNQGHTPSWDPTVGL